jgi:hypothetical protein
MGRSLALALCVALLLPPGLALPAGPVAPGAPKPGDRLRVTAPSLATKPLVGTVIEATERDLVLAVSPSEHRVIPRAELTRLERSLGRRRHLELGLLIGAASGAMVVGLGSCGGGTCTSGDAVAYALSGALLGALPGAAVGGLIQTETWAELPASDVHLTAGPIRGRGVALSLRWEW